MKKRRNFRKKPKDNSVGLSVKVYNNNVDGALRILKRKVKESNLFISFFAITISYLKYCVR